MYTFKWSVYNKEMEKPNLLLTLTVQHTTLRVCRVPFLLISLFQNSTGNFCGCDPHSPK